MTGEGKAALMASDGQRDEKRLLGTVVKVLPGGLFQVRLANGSVVIAHLSTRLRLSVSRLLVGEQVTVRLAAYNPSRGCIVEIGPP